MGYEVKWGSRWRCGGRDLIHHHIVYDRESSAEEGGCVSQFAGNQGGGRVPGFRFLDMICMSGVVNVFIKS